MQRWMIYTKKADFQELGARYQISPVLARILINRNVSPENFACYLYGDTAALHDPHHLKDIDRAADRILEAKEKGQKIRIVGDYDVDGVSATYILITAFQKIGLPVSYAIPDRIRDGYGINERIIREAAADGIELIVTCDNGISATEEIRLAGELGMDVVITDHHEVREIPPASAVVEPKQPDDFYPYKEICGATVAWKLVQVLYERCGFPEKEFLTLLPFVALATVGDVMPLQDENRILVREGIKSMAEQNNIGLQKLMEVCGISPDGVTAFSIGFVLGPCINAAGRLTSAEQALELFLEKNPEKAAERAAALKELNDSRKAMTEEFTEIAKRQIEENYPTDAVKVLYLPDCHESLAGIIAGRIKEAYHHPAIVFTDSDTGDYKGSARSIEAYNIFEKLQEQTELLRRFGGHRLAAGMSLPKENLEEFRNRLNAAAGLTEEDFREDLWIDTVLPLSYLSEEFVKELSLLEPFGQGNERPLFARKGLRVLSAKVLGREHNVAKLWVKDPEDGVTMDALIFGDGDEVLKRLQGKDTIDVLYYPQINEYQGRKSIQISIKGWK